MPLNVTSYKEEIATLNNRINDLETSMERIENERG